MSDPDTSDDEIPALSELPTPFDDRLDDNPPSSIPSFPATHRDASITSLTSPQPITPASLPTTKSRGHRRDYSRNSAISGVSSRGSAKAKPIEIKAKPSQVPLSTKLTMGGPLSKKTLNKLNTQDLQEMGMSDEASAEGYRFAHVNNYEKNFERKYISNVLRTTKYNWLNVIPKSIFEQFRRFSNFYFLIVCIVSYIPGVSPTNPITNLLPLVIVVGFGMIRDLYEDSKRYKADLKANLQPVRVLKRDDTYDNMPVKRCFKKGRPKERDMSDVEIDYNDRLYDIRASEDIAVGDIVRIEKGEIFPADLVLLTSSTEGGIAYVSTASLDGESNLKRNLCTTATADIRRSIELLKITGTVKYQKPDEAIHRFEGSFKCTADSMVCPLDSSNLLLRGCILKNTDYIHGLVVYTGYDTKIALNMRTPASKMGQIERKLNQVVIVLFLSLLGFIIIFATLAGVYQSRFSVQQWYMGPYQDDSAVKIGLKSLGTFLILGATYIPISLFVTLEFVRLIQGAFMYFDEDLFINNIPITVKATNLCEMLGSIEHILSDKTGTLTENIMRFTACSAGGKIYDIREKLEIIHERIQQKDESMMNLVQAMGLCHSVVPEPPEVQENENSLTTDQLPVSDSQNMINNNNNKKEALTDSPNMINNDNKEKEDLAETIMEADSEIREGTAKKASKSYLSGNCKDLIYQGQSPDEVALVDAARDFGVILLDRTIDTLTVEEFGKIKEYKMLAELEFNSDRKRMSMIFRGPDGSYRLFCKGADSIMKPLMKPGEYSAKLDKHLHTFAVEGLRTLVFAKKDLTTLEFDDWFEKFQAARNSLEDRDEKVAELSAAIEKDMDFLACTAVEDKLQDQVPETIQMMRDANVRLWVLTGDKRETAENIGYSANLLDRDMKVFHLEFHTAEECEDELNNVLDNLEEGDVDHREHETPSKFKTMSTKLSTLPGIRQTSSILKGSPSYLKKKERKPQEVGIIIDGPSLEFVLNGLPDLFMELAGKCKTVICCRVTPLQKAKVVTMVKEKRKAITLAIGDGGNDVSMIQAADIGVGIIGKEGAQAARAADFAIGGFKALKRLLLIHGRYGYVRTALVINMSFYKNMFFTLTQFYFTFFSFYSGTTFNQQWLITFFNVLLTSLNPFVAGCFERDLTEQTLLEHPSVYQSYLGSKLFNFGTVAEYILGYAVWHSICVFFGIYFSLGWSKTPTPFPNGQQAGFYFCGLANTSLVVFITHSKFLLMSHWWNWIILACSFISVAVFFILQPIIPSNLLKSYEMKGVFEHVFSSPVFWLLVLVIPTTAFLLDLLIILARDLVKPTLVRKLQIEEKTRVPNPKVACP